jgi:hypothetical protein
MNEKCIDTKELEIEVPEDWEGLISKVHNDNVFYGQNIQ